MKKNLRKIPADILAKLKSLGCNEVVVGCAIKFKSTDLAAGCLAHVGITLTEAGLQIAHSVVLPPASQGRYSKQNIEGEIIVRKDLPMITDTRAVESPNWGDSYNGTHTVYLPFKRYPRNFRPPRELTISVDCKDARAGLSHYILAFRVDEILSTNHADFKILLFENLNLLQENVGTCGVQKASESLADYAKSLHVSWEILPPGTRDEAIARIFSGSPPTQEEKDTASERYNFFISLKPKSLVYGSSGFRRYFGALIKDNLVVFENIQYGNAVYILFENWEELSKKSRLDLLSGAYETAFVRVVHGPGWKEAVRKIVEDKRNNK